MFRFAVIIISFLISGCVKPVPPNALPSAAHEKIEYLPLYYFDSTLELSPLEPEGGCMIGAYVEGDSFIKADFSTFEDTIGKEHDISGISMKMGQALPKDWLLKCIADKKTPIVTLYPQNMDNPFDTALLKSTANALATFNVPMLVNFFPNPDTYSNSQKYAAYYQNAREVFKQFAPNTAFVWSVTHDDPNNWKTFYPEASYVDYIGLSFYIKSGEQCDAVRQRLKQWYYAWQCEKPLVVFNAVSHYSTATTVYTENESAAILTQIYADIQNYPRIKAVIYVDENLSTGAPVIAPRENYTVIQNNKMREAYSLAIRHDHFTKKSYDDKAQCLKSPFDAVELNGRLFIPKNAVYYCLEETLNATPRTIDDKLYYSQDAFSLYDVTKNNQKVYLSPKTP